MSISSKELVLFFCEQINKARTHPRAFLQQLSTRLSRIDRNAIYTRADIPSLHIQTLEGPGAVKEAYDYLLAQPPLEALQLSLQLCEVAFAIGAEVLKAAQSQELAFHERLMSELQKNGCRAEKVDVVIQLGFGKDHELLPCMLIDDGDSLRNRRKALLSSHYQYVGLAVHEHPQFDYQLVVVLTTQLQQLFPNPQDCQHCRLI